MTRVRMAVSAAERSVMGARVVIALLWKVLSTTPTLQLCSDAWTDCQPRAAPIRSRHCAASSKMQEVEIKPIAPVEPGEVRLIPQTAAELEAAAAAAQAASVPTDFKKGNRAYTEKLYKEEQGLKEIAEAFNMLDVSGSGLKGIGDAKITLDEFKKGITRLQLHDPPGSAPGWKDDAFDRFDVDKSGFVDYNELCFALGREVMNAKANGIKKTAKECLQDVIGGLQQTQTAAKVAAMAAAKSNEDIARLDEGRREEAAEAAGKLAADAAVVQVEQTSAEEQNDECGMYFCLTIFPCCILCHGFGKAMGGEKIEGMEKAVEYVSKGKDDLPDFRWHIQNYHYKRVKKKKGGTRRVRVNTHRATLTGTLSAKDKSEVFVPNTRLRNVALVSNLVVHFEPSFDGEYHRQLEDFYKRNTKDKYQDKSCSYSMPHLNGTDSDGVRIEWVAGKDPWWANNECKWITCCTFTAVCWFHAMKSFMAAEDYHYVKEATGWHNNFFDRQAEVTEAGDGDAGGDSDDDD